MIVRLTILVLLADLAIGACSNKGDGTPDASDGMDAADAGDDAGDEPGDPDPQPVDGALVWVRAAGGTGVTWGMSLAALDDGSTLVTGLLTGRATFGAGEANETTLPADLDRVAYVARFHADGDLAWARRVHGTGQYDQGQGIATHSDGSCIVGGRFTGATAVFGPGNPNETTLTNVAPGNGDAFFARFNVDGNF